MIRASILCLIPFMVHCNDGSLPSSSGPEERPSNFRRFPLGPSPLSVVTMPVPLELPPTLSDVETMDEDERMCDVAINVYFRSERKAGSSVRDTVRPHLKNLIKVAQDSPERQHREGIDSLRRILSGVATQDDHNAVKYIHDMVAKATEVAVEKQQSQIDTLQTQVKGGVKKSTAAIMSIITAVLGAAVSIAGTFGSNSC